MICPDCQGSGTLVAYHVSYSKGRSGFNVPFKCDRCQGTGQVPDIQAEWIKEGKRLKEMRMEPYRTMMQEAKLRGISVVELSQMELGKIKPVFP